MDLGVDRREYQKDLWFNRVCLYLFILFDFIYMGVRVQFNFKPIHVSDVLAMDSANEQLNGHCHKNWL